MSQHTRPQVQLATAGRCRPNPGPGHWVAILTTVVNNNPVKKVLSGTLEDANNQRMELLAVVEALEHLKCPCDVTLKPLSKYVVDGLSKWLDNWLVSNWQTSKRQPVKNADLWQRIVTQMDRHTLTVEWLKMDTSETGMAHKQQLTALLEQAPQPTAQLETDAASTRPYRLLIAGSRHASDNMLRYVRHVVAKAIANGWTIVVGDNPEGVDCAVVEECNRLHRTDVIVVGIANQPRNGGVTGGRYFQRGLSYGDRDRQMALAADRGIYIWDGQSNGTYQGYRTMQDLGKPADLINFAKTFA